MWIAADDIFLTAPEYTWTSDETPKFARNKKQSYFPKQCDDSKNVTVREDTSIKIIRKKLKRVGNSFIYNGPSLKKLATKSVFWEEIK